MYDPSATRLITDAAHCNINQFMACMFDDNLSALIITGHPTEAELMEAFENILTEYIDASGLIDNDEEIRLIMEIESLQIKIKVIDTSLQVQESCLAFFGYPFFEGLPVLRRFGYSLKWDKDNPELEGFKKQLSDTKIRSCTYKVSLEDAKTTLDDYYKMKQKVAPKEMKKSNARKHFVDLLVTLPTAGFVINRESTMIEELGSMVRLYKEMKSPQPQAEPVGQKYHHTY